jgi:hypothetical protein
VFKSGFIKRQKILKNLGLIIKIKRNQEDM